MLFLLFGFLLLHFSNCEAVKQSGLEDAVKSDPQEMMYKSENGIGDKSEELLQKVERTDIDWKLEKIHLENKLEAKNAEVENLQKRLTEMEVQLESRVEEVLLRTQKKNENQEVASLKGEIRAEVKKEVEKVLPAAVEQGLRDLPYEMVCAFQPIWPRANSVLSYNRITVEFNNSNQPGGADGTMNIETGVFTTVTSGYYIITFSGSVLVGAGGYTVMFLYHNGVRVDESVFNTSMKGEGEDQASRTVVRDALKKKYGIIWEFFPTWESFHFEREVPKRGGWGWVWGGG